MKPTQKRNLTESEIEFVLDFMQLNPYIPKDTASFLLETNKKQLKDQLKEIRIYPHLLELLKENIKEQYFSTLVQPGEAVGVLTAQSIGEKQTQSTLNLFHRAGAGSNQMGVSKFSELLNATSNPKNPMYTIHFVKDNDDVTKLRNLIGFSIIELTIKKLAEKISFSIDKKPEVWYDTFYIMTESTKDPIYTNCVTLKINLNLLYEYKLTLKQIAQKIKDTYQDCYCIYSPDCFNQIDVFFDTSSITLPEEKLGFVTEENEIEIYLEEVCIPNLQKMIICGIQGILNMFFLQDKGKWLVETENMREKTVNVKFNKKAKKTKKNKEKTLDSCRRFKKLLAHPHVDITKTLSNNIWDIYQVFGIEAVRQYMIDEFCKIMEGINPCHVMLLVDKMTFNGVISSISRYTMRTDDSILSRASFEETLDNLLNAGINGQNEITNGISASIICGKKVPIGTGYSTLSVDVDKLIG